MNVKDPALRFSDIVGVYVKYRPHYPDEIINFLSENAGLSKNCLIADIGSGTGILSESFLNNGNKVFAVEPNFEMRKAAEKLMKDFPGFISINGFAENTFLESNTIDFIVSGQAFHWFEREKCKSEFIRILKKEGYAVLIWNSRISKEGIMNDYENLLRKFGTDYNYVNHENIKDSDIENFYSPNKFSKVKFPNFQEFDYEGIKGRLLSCSYIPDEKSSLFNEMIKNLKNIFDKNSVSGKVRFEYETVLYYGNLN